MGWRRIRKSKRNPVMSAVSLGAKGAGWDSPRSVGRSVGHDPTAARTTWWLRRGAVQVTATGWGDSWRLSPITALSPTHHVFFSYITTHLHNEGAISGNPGRGLVDIGLAGPEQKGTCCRRRRGRLHLNILRTVLTLTQSAGRCRTHRQCSQCRRQSHRCMPSRWPERRGCLSSRTEAGRTY